MSGESIGVAFSINHPKCSTDSRAFRAKRPSTWLVWNLHRFVANRTRYNPRHFVIGNELTSRQFRNSFCRNVFSLGFFLDATAEASPRLQPVGCTPCLDNPYCGKRTWSSPCRFRRPGLLLPDSTCPFAPDSSARCVGLHRRILLMLAVYPKRETPGWDDTILDVRLHLLSKHRIVQMSCCMSVNNRWIRTGSASTCRTPTRLGHKSAVFERHGTLQIQIEVSTT